MRTGSNGRPRGERLRPEPRVSSACPSRGRSLIPLACPAPRQHPSQQGLPPRPFPALQPPLERGAQAARASEAPSRSTGFGSRIVSRSAPAPTRPRANVRRCRRSRRRCRPRPPATPRARSRPGHAPCPSAAAVTGSPRPPAARPMPSTAAAPGGPPCRSAAAAGHPGTSGGRERARPATASAGRLAAQRAKAQGLIDDHEGLQVFSASPSWRAATAAFRTPGYSHRTRSISSTSTRESSDLHLQVGSATELDVSRQAEIDRDRRVREQAPRPPPWNGSGTNRSAVSPGSPRYPSATPSPPMQISPGTPIGVGFMSESRM